MWYYYLVCQLCSDSYSAFAAESTGEKRKIPRRIASAEHFLHSAAVQLFNTDYAIMESPAAAIGE